MAQFRKKPVEINASLCLNKQVIKTLEGEMTAEPGDWIITGVEGEKYPCKHSIFVQTYEPVNEEASNLMASRRSD